MCQTLVFGEQLFSVLDDIQAVPYTRARTHEQGRASLYSRKCRYCFAEVLTDWNSLTGGYGIAVSVVIYTDHML